MLLEGEFIYMASTEFAVLDFTFRPAGEDDQSKHTAQGECEMQLLCGVEVF